LCNYGDCMKSTHIILIILVFIGSNITLYSQNVGLYEYPDPEIITLTDRQQELRENAESRAYVDQTFLVRIREAGELMNKASVSINLPDERIVSGMRSNSRTIGNGHFIWNGTAEEAASSIQFIVPDKV